MPDFAYTARDLQGKKVAGKISAQSERDALSAIAGQSLFPLQVTADKPPLRLFGGRRVNGQLLATTYGQLASLLRSGVPMLRSINVIRDQSSNRTLKEVLTEIHDKVEEGTPLGDALARHPRIFGEMAINMVRAGGEGGFLEDALERVAVFTEQQEDLKSRTIGALAYPLFLGTVGSLVVSALIVFFVPKFAIMFDRLREQGELPMLTEWLLMFSAFTRSWGWLFLIVVAVLLLVVRQRLETEDGKRMRDLLKLKIPLLGSILLSLAVARFCRVLGTLLKNGVPILKSLDISSDAAGNRILSEAIKQAAENISSGESLARPLASSGHFPSTVVEMIAVAEESNTLDKVLIEVADGLERNTARRLDLFVRLLEPLMLLVLAGVVLFVVVALLLPVIKMSQTI